MSSFHKFGIIPEKNLFIQVLRTPTDGVSGADALKVLKLIKYSKMNRKPVEGQWDVFMLVSTS